MSSSAPRDYAPGFEIPGSATVNTGFYGYF